MKKVKHSSQMKDDGKHTLKIKFYLALKNKNHFTPKARRNATTNQNNVALNIFTKLHSSVRLT